MALPAGTMALTIEYAQGLKDKDWFGKQDPYCVLTCGGQRFRSKTHTDGGKAPVWNETFTFNVINENTAQIEIWDADTLSRDDRIGSCTVDLSKARTVGSDCQQVAVRTGKQGKQHGFISVKIAFTPNQPVQPQHQPPCQALPPPHMPYPPASAYGAPPPYYAPSFAHQPSMYGQPATAPYPGPYTPAPSFAAPPPHYAPPPSSAYPPPGYGAPPPGYGTPPPASAPAPVPPAAGAARQQYYPSVPTQQFIPGPAGPPPPMRLH